MSPVSSVLSPLHPTATAQAQNIIVCWSMTAASEPMNPPCTVNGLLGPAPSHDATFQPLLQGLQSHTWCFIKLSSCSSLFSLPRIPTQLASLPFPHLPGNEDFLKDLPQSALLLGTSLITRMEGVIPSRDRETSVRLQCKQILPTLSSPPDSEQLKARNSLVFLVDTAPGTKERLRCKRDVRVLPKTHR